MNGERSSIVRSQFQEERMILLGPLDEPYHREICALAARQRFKVVDVDERAGFGLVDSRPQLCVKKVSGRAEDSCTMSCTSCRPRPCTACQRVRSAISIAGNIPLVLLVKDFSVLYGDAEFDSLVDETRFTQPALYAVCCALSDLYRSWGVEPGAAAGHSVGEYAAAYATGVFDLETGLRLVTERARLLQGLAGHGAMAAIFAGEERVAKAIASRPGIALAAINGPRNTVISGDAEALGEVRIGRISPGFARRESIGSVGLARSGSGGSGGSGAGKLWHAAGPSN